MSSLSSSYPKLLHYISVIIIVHIIYMPVYAQLRATMEDLVQEPENYYGMEVRIIGKVITAFELGYVLQNDIGNIIEVVSNDMPEVERKYEVVVKVLKKVDSYEPLLKEVRRKRYTGGNSWIVIFSILLLAGMFSAGGWGDNH